MLRSTYNIRSNILRYMLITISFFRLFCFSIGPQVAQAGRCRGNFACWPGNFPRCSDRTASHPSSTAKHEIHREPWNPGIPCWLMLLLACSASDRWAVMHQCAPNPRAKHASHWRTPGNLGAGKRKSGRSSEALSLVRPLSPSTLPFILRNPRFFAN